MLFFGLFLFPSISESQEKGKNAEKIVITAEEIEDMNVRSVAELLNQIPGIHAGDSSVSIRGSSMVRVFIDGRPLNDPLSTSRSIRWNSVDLDNIEEIEIYKGGGVVIFGGDSSGGVISLKTKETKGSQGNIEIYGGNFNTQSYRLNYQQDIKISSTLPDVETSDESETLGVGLSGGWYKTDGFRINDDEDKKRIGAKIGYKPAKVYSFDLSLDYSEEDKGSPGLPSYPTPKARTEYTAFGSSFIGKIYRLQAGTHFSCFEKEHRNPEKNLETLLKCWSFKEKIKLPISIDRHGSINTGLNFGIDKVSGNKIESHQEEECGLYASKQILFEDIFTKLSLGLRWNYHSEYDHVLNPEIKLGFDWDSFGLQLSALKTNNTPTFLQRYYESSTTTPNPDLGMETAMNYSVSLLYHPKTSFEGNVSLFFNKVKDRITYVRGDGGIGRYENFGEVTMKGAEISLKWNPLDALEIRPSYIYLLAKDEQTGNWLPCKKKHHFKFDLKYRPVADLTLALNTSYVSKQYTKSDNTESVPDYFLADFRGDYYLKKLRLFIEVKNLFDKDYYYGDGYPAPPRTWIAGLSCPF
jgi:iron complex outermembrane receptor protein